MALIETLSLIALVGIIMFPAIIVAYFDRKGW